METEHAHSQGEGPKVVEATLVYISAAKTICSTIEILKPSQHQSHHLATSITTSTIQPHPPDQSHQPYPSHQSHQSPQVTTSPYHSQTVTPSLVAVAALLVRHNPSLATPITATLLPLALPRRVFPLRGRCHHRWSSYTACSQPVLARRMRCSSELTSSELIKVASSTRLSCGSRGAGTRIRAP